MDKTIIRSLKEVNVLVLGGSGVIGSRMVEVLVEACQANVSVLVRNLAKAVRVARYPVELIHGDVMDQGLLHTAMENKSLVIDCTFASDGNYKERCAKGRAMARAIGEAALDCNVQRLVHLSTISVYGPLSGEMLNEESERKPGSDAYGASKLAGEDEMLRLYRDRSLPVVVLQPTIVYGPFTGWTAGPIDQLRHGTFVLPDEGQGACNAVYLDDVVQSVLRAAVVKNVNGEVFLVSGDTAVTWIEFYGAYESMLGFTSTIGMREREIEEQLKNMKRNARPVRRFLQTLRQEASLRQMVMALPLISQFYGAVRSFTPKKQMEKIKDRLLDKKIDDNSVEHKPLLFPTSIQLGIYAPSTQVSIDKARALLGYAPTFNLESGMNKTRDWADWARLI